MTRQHRASLSSHDCCTPTGRRRNTIWKCQPKLLVELIRKSERPVVLSCSRAELSKSILDEDNADYQGTKMTPWTKHRITVFKKEVKIAAETPFPSSNFAEASSTRTCFQLFWFIDFTGLLLKQHRQFRHSVQNTLPTHTPLGQKVREQPLRLISIAVDVFRGIFGK